MRQDASSFRSVKFMIYTIIFFFLDSLFSFPNIICLILVPQSLKGVYNNNHTSVGLICVYVFVEQTTSAVFEGMELCMYDQHQVYFCTAHLTACRVICPWTYMYVNDVSLQHHFLHLSSSRYTECFKIFNNLLMYLDIVNNTCYVNSWS